MNSGDPVILETLRTATFSYTRWRESFLRLILYGSTIIGFVTAAAASLDMLRSGEYILAAVYAISWLILLVVTLGRWPYWLRAGIFLALVYILGLSGLLENGMRGDARLFFFALVILMALFFSPRAGILGAVWGLLNILVVAVLIFSGHYHLTSKVTSAGDPTLWIVSSLDLVLIETVVLSGLSMFLGEFKAAQVRVGRVLSDLAQERTLLRTLIDNIPDSVYVKDLLGRKTLVNPADMLFMGKQTEAEVLGKTDQEIFQAENAAQFLQDDQQILKTGQPLINREELVTDSYQNQRWLLTSKIPLRDAEGKIVGLVGIGRDITERKRAEQEILRLNSELEQRVIVRTAQLEAVNQEMEAFSYSVSHDLRAPLRAIDGYSHILQEDYAQQLPAEASQLLGSVRERAQMMGALIDDLLRFSRLSRQPLNKQLVDPAVLVRHALQTLNHEQENRNVKIKIGELPSCQGDPALLTQVWVNLLSNALKFTRGCAAAQIEVGCQVNEMGEAVYHVKDNGVGFNMKYADKLFGVFQRLHSVEEFEGTGVGLALVQRIIARHGGRIWVDAQVGAGATFFFAL